ncbi:hypothetical protein [Spirosoma utsteinense]|uniref:Uncharacterized protein n=2 Tax=Spirosoma utsteinense TaxID=2585773 RepID=A0ABR6WCM7_9BACT|nr:hypothetical protein [Spirosoma utsteinense]MBC3794044.1 hypothetical protein [Spirosoma utsteinense]
MMSTTGQQPDSSTGPNPPRQPDYLLILMIGLFLLALLIAFLTDVPALLR